MGTERTLADYAYVTGPPHFLALNIKLWQAWAYVQGGHPGRNVETDSYAIHSEAVEGGTDIVLRVRLRATR